MDFSARVRDKDGREELIIMELQKAKLPSDIMRFRRYLGAQYSDKNNVAREPAAAYKAQSALAAPAETEVAETDQAKALPILSIYFLGHTLERVKAPVLWVNRVYKDMTTGEPIRDREEFVECLTHDSIIIQIPYLKGKRRNDLERLLALFDQSSLASDRHFLNIEEEELPERYRPLLRRLHKALADDTLRRSMDAEDDYVEDIKNFQRQIERRDQALKEMDHAIQEKDHAIQEKDHAIQEKEHAIQEKEHTLQEKEHALQEIQHALQETQRQLELAIRSLYAAGTPIPQIATAFTLSEAEVEAMLKTLP
jgi:hypothetical protein